MPYQRCPNCNGLGCKPGADFGGGDIPCGNCGGTGKTYLADKSGSQGGTVKPGCAVAGVVLAAIVLFLSEANQRWQRQNAAPVGIENDDQEAASLDEGELYVRNRTNQRVELEIETIYDADGNAEEVNVEWSVSAGDEFYPMRNGRRYRAARADYTVWIGNRRRSLKTLPRDLKSNGRLEIPIYE